MAWISRDQDRALTRQQLDPLVQLEAAVSAASPWESIIDFATHPSFCGKRLYPRQRTLLRLMYLEIDHMTDYDMDVIEHWRAGFSDKSSPCGVQPDVWDRVHFLRSNGYRHFTHILACLGRRASKGMLGGILGAEKLAYMYSLDDWQAHYGLDPGIDGELTVIATSQSQAARRQFADIRRAVEGCKYLRPAIASNKGTELTIRTPADVRRIADLRAAGVPIDREIASLRASAVSSSSSAGRGGSGFANFYDEFAHMLMGSGSVKSGEEIYEAYQPSLDQFGKDSLTYIPSSPYTQVGKFYELFRQGAVLGHDGGFLSRRGGDDLDPDDAPEVQADPEMLVVQVPSWELYTDWERSAQIQVVKTTRPDGSSRFGPPFKRPVQWPPDGDKPENLRMRLLERRNPEKFGVERRAKFANVMNAYLDPASVESMFDDPGWRPALSEQDRGYLTRAYRVHCDPSKSGANFAMAIGHLEEAPPDEHGEVWPHVVFDWLHVWKPEDFPIDESGKHRIDYVLIQKRIEEMLLRYPSTRRVTFDQWNSAGMISHLQHQFAPRIIIAEETATADSNRRRAERFKSALNLGWVHAYRDSLNGEEGSLLETELKFLTEKNGRVDRQEFGPCTTKDLSDCVMTITADLLHNALDRWNQKLIGATAFGSTDVPGLRAGREVERAAAVLGMGADPRAGQSARAVLSQMKQDRARGLGLGNRGAGYSGSTRGKSPVGPRGGR